MRKPLSPRKKASLAAFKGELIKDGWQRQRGDARRSIWSRPWTEDPTALFIPERNGPDFDGLLALAKSRKAAAEGKLSVTP